LLAQAAVQEQGLPTHEDWLFVYWANVGSSAVGYHVQRDGWVVQCGHVATTSTDLLWRLTTAPFQTTSGTYSDPNFIAGSQGGASQTEPVFIPCSKKVKAGDIIYFNASANVARSYVWIAT
jgi:hypothetical protein